MASKLSSLHPRTHARWHDGTRPLRTYPAARRRAMIADSRLSFLGYCMASKAIRRLLSALRTHLEVTIVAAKQTLSPTKFQNPDGLGKPFLEKLCAHLGRLKEADV